MYLCLSICLSLCLLCVELFSNIFWLNWSSPTTSSLSVSVCLLLTFYFFVSLFIAPSVFLSVPLSLSLSLPLCFSISLRASVSLHHKTLKIFFQRIPLKKYFLLQSSWHQSHFSLVTRFSQCHNWKWWYCYHMAISKVCKVTSFSHISSCFIIYSKQTYHNNESLKLEL